MPTRMIVSTTSLAFDAVRSCAGRREGALGRCRRRVSPSRWPAGGEVRQGSRSRRCRRERHTELTHLFRGVAPVAGEQPASAKPVGGGPPEPEDRCNVLVCCFAAVFFGFFFCDELWPGIFTQRRGTPVVCSLAPLSSARCRAVWYTPRRASPSWVTRFPACRPHSDCTSLLCGWATSSTQPGTSPLATRCARVSSNPPAPAVSAHPLKSTSLRRSDVKSLKVGKVGLDYTTEEGAEMAKIIALELLATLKHELGRPACERCLRLREAALWVGLCPG